MNENFNKNVIINDDIKKEINQVFDFKKHKKYIQFGIEVPRGILLYGPPGTGKTTIAKYISEIDNANFIAVSGSEFIEKYVGVGSKRIRDLFNNARRKAVKNKNKSIIFIDEIDAIGTSRYGGENNKEVEQTLNQLLVEMDGLMSEKEQNNTCNFIDENGRYLSEEKIKEYIKDKNKDLIIIGATNRLDILDKALLRPGRFSKIIKIDLPDLKSREQLFKLYLEKILSKGKINYKELAKISEGMSGAEISNIITEAAMKVIDEERDKLMQKDITYFIKNLENKKEEKERTIGFSLA